MRLDGRLVGVELLGRARRRDAWRERYFAVVAAFGFLCFLRLCVRRALAAAKRPRFVRPPRAGDLAKETKKASAACRILIRRYCQGSLLFIGCPFLNAPCGRWGFYS